MECMSLPDLADFCDLLQVELPDLVAVAPDAIPEPYHHLLVHDGDMTGRLQAFHQSGIRLRTLRIMHQPGTLCRHVLLQTEEQRTVELGAIRIHLGSFRGGALDAVLGCHQPLGGILNAYGISYQSNLAGFFTIRADATLADTLDITIGTRLFGRFNRLQRSEGAPIAEVVEILPPTLS